MMHPRFFGRRLSNNGIGESRLSCNICIPLGLFSSSVLTGIVRNAICFFVLHAIDYLSFLPWISSSSMLAAVQAATD